MHRPRELRHRELCSPSVLHTGRLSPPTARPSVFPRSSMAAQHGGLCGSRYPALHRLSWRHTCPATLPMVEIDARNCYTLSCNWPQSRELRGLDARYWPSAACTKPRWHLTRARGVRVVLPVWLVLAVCFVPPSAVLLLWVLPWCVSWWPPSGWRVRGQNSPTRLKVTFPTTRPLS